MFNDSTNSTDLRNNGPGQDWYESRGALGGTGNSSLLTLDTSDVGGNTGKKAGLKNYGIAQDAYLTQEFSSAQTGAFNVSLDVYIDRIEDNADYDRSGLIYIGDDRISTNCPTGTSDERFVFLTFYDSSPGDTGTDLEIRARTLAAQSYSNTSSWPSVATGLSYDEWYRIKVVLNVTGGKYDVYVDGVLKGDDISKYGGYTSTNVTYISLSADSAGRGDFYVDNVFAPAQDTQMKVVPSITEAIVGQELTVYINVTAVTDLYAWEFQFNYNPSILDLTYNGAVSGGLKEPTQTFYSLTNETSGHLWWVVSTTYPNTTGISYSTHAIFEIRFNITNIGTSNLDLSGTILSKSNATPIYHTVVNASISVETLDLTVTEIEMLNKYGNETWQCSIYANDTYVDDSIYYYPVNVTIENTGTLDAENFKVLLDVYYDTTLEASAVREGISLAGSSTKELTFTDLFHPNKTGDPGKYGLKATVDSGNDIAEDNEDNNVKTKNDFMVTVVGDVNKDKTVNILDAVKLALAWNGTPGDTQWNVCADLNHDETINILDGVRIGLHWGENW